MIFDGINTVIPVWGIQRVDPGFIYVFENNGRYKIGKTKSSKNRLKAARTWLPDLVLIAIKPFWNLSSLERLLHVGFANYWYSGEWFSFGEDDDARDLLVDEFRAFSDLNPDQNSVDFIYWYNSEGMIEFQIEMARQQHALKKFQKENSPNRKRFTP